MSHAAAQTVVPYAQVEQLREARNIVAHEGQALLDLARRLDTTVCDAIERIASCRGCVVVCGVGKAGLIGQKIAATFSSTGTRAFFLHPTEAFHGDLGSLGSDDVLLLLSHSGESEEVCRLLPWVRSVGIPMIAITGECHSTVGRAAEITIELGRLIEAGLHGLPPTTSTTAMLAIGDALALVVAQTRGFTPQQFGRLHPGGSLGRRLTPVKDVMRSGDEMRIAAQTESVRNVLTSLRRPGRRTGAVILVDEEDRLSGLFTDSDLARLLEQRRDDQLDRPIVEVMTARPITIREDAILEEAVGLLSARRLSELPVVDEDGRPVGLLDITDVIGLIPK
ncbi:MAG TPA: KpsF/GutQ family sugar-phosphate isomerase [Planctomycetaceae bacterium]|nr:KpsF/GutQ family sugar-phosphate isomerase [Planctomycetaceae bacterium]